jgi:hypothetical protein
MRSRQASINSTTITEDDEQQPLLNITSPNQQHNHVMLNGNEDPVTGINTDDDKERETKPLLDEYQVEPSPAGFFLCRKIPARYALAIWAFFGFFALYAMRVNLSVAIVAMVCESIVCDEKFKIFDLGCTTKYTKSIGSSMSSRT